MTLIPKYRLTENSCVCINYFDILQSLDLKGGDEGGEKKE
jgi:hypothetical protein